MKNILLLVLITSAQWAFAGSEGVGGGDLCENRIQVIRDDIAGWITQGGPSELKLPLGITTTQYSTKMMTSIKNTKVRCVKSGDVGFPVQINSTPKVCRFDSSISGNQITCDYEAFLNNTSMSESDQYVLIHHEFAGIAGLENPMADVSSYSISNQISGYLADQVVKKLVINKSSAPVSSAVYNCQAKIHGLLVKNYLKLIIQDSLIMEFFIDEYNVVKNGTQTTYDELTPDYPPELRPAINQARLGAKTTEKGISEINFEFVLWTDSAAATQILYNVKLDSISNKPIVARSYKRPKGYSGDDVLHTENIILICK